MHWWVAAMALLYAVSGITVIRRRRGGGRSALGTSRRRHAGAAGARPGPALRVPAADGPGGARPDQARLGARDRRRSPSATRWSGPGDTLDPLTVGYALTGDQNIVHVAMMARYRVRDPAEWAFYGPRSEDMLRVEVTAAMVRSLGEMGVDRVLADGRKDLIATATRRAQAGLDAAHSGLELVSLELTAARAAARRWRRTSTPCRAPTSRRRPGRRRPTPSPRSVIPQAQAEADAAVQAARADRPQRGRAPGATRTRSSRSSGSIAPTRRSSASGCTATPWSRRLAARGSLGPPPPAWWAIPTSASASLGGSRRSEPAPARPEDEP